MEGHAGMKVKLVVKCVRKVRSIIYYKNYCTQINLKRMYQMTENWRPKTELNL